MDARPGLPATVSEEEKLVHLQVQREVRQVLRLLGVDPPAVNDETVWFEYDRMKDAADTLSHAAWRLLPREWGG